MSGLDLLLLVGLGAGVWRGLQTGAVLQIAGIAGWILALVLAAAWAPAVGDVVVESLGLSLRLAPLIGAVLVFAAVAGGVFAVAHASRKALQTLKLGALDRAAGAGVGGLRAAFGLSVLLAALSFAPFGEPLLLPVETCRDSVLCAPVRTVAPSVWSHVRDRWPGGDPADDAPTADASR